MGLLTVKVKGVGVVQLNPGPTLVLRVVLVESLNGLWEQVPPHFRRVVLEEPKVLL